MSNLLPHKRDNREKVRKDEEEAKIHQERAHATKTQSERIERIEKLRRLNKQAEEDGKGGDDDDDGDGVDERKRRKDKDLRRNPNPESHKRFALFDDKMTIEPSDPKGTVQKPSNNEKSSFKVQSNRISAPSKSWYEKIDQSGQRRGEMIDREDPLHLFKKPKKDPSKAENMRKSKQPNVYK